MWNGYDPRDAATNATNWLSTTGYDSFDDNNNTDALTAIGPNFARDDAVFVVFGHGLPGQIAVEKNGVVGAITANSHLALSPDFSAGVRANLYDKPTDYWSLMKLAVWIACDSGVDGDASLPFKGNLVRESVNDMGASSGLGFMYLIYAVPNALDLWTDGFFHALNDNGGSPATVADAASAGAANVRFWWGTANNTWGFANPFILNGNVKVKPAGYGN